MVGYSLPPALHATRAVMPPPPPPATPPQAPPVRNQGTCGACWAFASLGALEVKAAITGVAPVSGLNPDLSEQEMVDCVTAALPTGYRSRGCVGGYSGEHTTLGRLMTVAASLHLGGCCMQRGDVPPLPSARTSTPLFVQTSPSATPLPSLSSRRPSTRMNPSRAPADPPPCPRPARSRCSRPQGSPPSHQTLLQSCRWAG